MNKMISDLLNDANNTWRQQREETRAFVNKWEKSGLLEGIEHEYERHNTAILLENQARQLVYEASTTNAGAGEAREDWNGVALPLVRRIFGQISAKEFVSVQPMNLPSGLVFYLDFKYGGPDTAGRFTGDVMGNTSSSSTPTGGLYGKNKGGYSLKQRTKTVSLITAATASWAELGFDAELSSSTADGGASGTQTFKLSFPTTALSEAVDVAAVQMFVATGSGGVTAATNLGEYHYISTGATTATRIFKNENLPASCSLFIQATAAPSEVQVTYFENTLNSYARGDFEDTNPVEGGNPSSGTNLNIPEINVELRQEAIVAKTRKLKVVWSPEFAQDLNAYHSIDAEAELTSMLSEYVAMEIDLEILGMIEQAALHVDNWSADIGQVIAAGASAPSAVTVSAAAAYNQQSWFQTLGTKVQKLSNKIYQSTMRGQANFIVVSPEVSTILESIPGYSVDTTGDQTQYAMGVAKVGTLANRFTIYKNPYFLDNVLLMGFRGTQFLETGAVYAPYIPLIMTPLVYDPTNFTPRKGVMTRYAKKVVRPEFFGKIYIAGLDSF